MTNCPATDDTPQGTTDPVGGGNPVGAPITGDCAWCLVRGAEYAYPNSKHTTSFLCPPCAWSLQVAKIAAVEADRDRYKAALERRDTTEDANLALAARLDVLTADRARYRRALQRISQCNGDYTHAEGGPSLVAARALGGES